MVSTQRIDRLEDAFREMFVVAVELRGDGAKSLTVPHEGGQLQELGAEEQLEGLRLNGVHVQQAEGIAIHDRLWLPLGHHHAEGVVLGQLLHHQSRVVQVQTQLTTLQLVALQAQVLNDNGLLRLGGGVVVSVEGCN